MFKLIYINLYKYYFEIKNIVIYKLTKHNQEHNINLYSSDILVKIKNVNKCLYIFYIYIH